MQDNQEITVGVDLHELLGKKEVELAAKGKLIERLKTELLKTREQVAHLSQLRDDLARANEELAAHAIPNGG